MSFQFMNFRWTYFTWPYEKHWIICKILKVGFFVSNDLQIIVSDERTFNTVSCIFMLAPVLELEMHTNKYISNYFSLSH